MSDISTQRKIECTFIRPLAVAGRRQQEPLANRWERLRWPFDERYRGRGSLIVGIFLTNQQRALALEHIHPMATTNPDLDPFYLRYVVFYVTKWSISQLVTDISKDLRFYTKACSNIADFLVLDTLASMAMSFSNSSIPMAVCVTPITRTTGTTVLSGKKVSEWLALPNTSLILSVKCGLVRWWWRN